jgi:NTE family protein
VSSGAKVAPLDPLRPRRRGHGSPRTAFVLSGGASLGAMQVGMLGALFEQGIHADLLVATSVGALNAAFVASRPQTVQTSSALARVWRRIRRDDIFPVSLFALVGGLSGRRDHLVPDQALRQLVRRNIEFDDLADARTPLHVLAFDIVGAREVLLSAGPAVDAVCAAASIPGLFPPVPIGEWRLIDGAVLNNTPISHAVELGAERIYVLPTYGGSRPLQRPPQTALDAAVYGLSVMLDGLLERDIAWFSKHVELIVMPSPNPLQVQPGDFDHASRLIRDARSASRMRLAMNGGQKLRAHGPNHRPATPRDPRPLGEPPGQAASAENSPSPAIRLAARERRGSRKSTSTANRFHASASPRPDALLSQAQSASGSPDAMTAERTHVSSSSRASMMPGASDDGSSEAAYRRAASRVSPARSRR